MWNVKTLIKHSSFYVLCEKIEDFHEYLRFEEWCTKAPSGTSEKSSKIHPFAFHTLGNSLFLKKYFQSVIILVFANFETYVNGFETILEGFDWVFNLYFSENKHSWVQKSFQDRHILPKFLFVVRRLSHSFFKRIEMSN